MDPSTDAGPFRLLFVCTGNTCRSPMAEVIARARIAELGWDQVVVASAGVGAWEGSPASGGSLRAAEARGLSLADHESTLLTSEVASSADLILTMSASHLQRVDQLGAADRATLLTAFASAAEDPSQAAGIPDPIGGPDEEYAQTFEVLDRLVEQVLHRLKPVVQP